MIFTIEIENNSVYLAGALIISFLLFILWIKFYNRGKLEGIKLYGFPLLIIAVLLGAMIKFIK